MGMVEEKPEFVLCKLQEGEQPEHQRSLISTFVFFTPERYSIYTGYIRNFNIIARLYS